MEFFGRFPETMPMLRVMSFISFKFYGLDVWTYTKIDDCIRKQKHRRSVVDHCLWWSRSS